MKRLLRALHDRYVETVWAFLDRLAWLWFRPPPAPEEVARILHVAPLSHKPYMLSRLLRRHGVEADYLVVGSSTGWLRMEGAGYDDHLPSPKSLWAPLLPWLQWLALRRMLRYDVIHYHFNCFLTPGGRELKYLRRAGKVVVCHFRGCDLRSRAINERLHPELNCCSECDYPRGLCDAPAQRIRLAAARAHGDLFFVTTPDLLDFWPDAEHLPFVAPTEIDLAAIQPAPRSKRFRIVTSSNHDGIDGTAYVRDAVSRLRERGEAIELVEIRRTPYAETLRLYASADLYVGKLRMGYYNNAIIECLALGVPCMCYVREDLAATLPDCPLILARPETVAECIAEWLHRREELRALGRRGPAWVQANHDPDDIARRLLDRYREALLAKEAPPTDPTGPADSADPVADLTPRSAG